MKVLIVPMIVYYIGMLLNIFAPGNNIRAMVSQGMNPIKAVMLALMYGLKQCVGDWSSWVVIIAFLVIGMLAWKMTANSDFSYPWPALVPVLAYCLTSAMMAPSLFAVSSKEAGRIEAVTYFVFLMTSVFSVIYVVGWLRSRYDHKISEKECQAVFEPSYRSTLVLAMLFFLFGSTLCIFNDSHYYACTSAITDLVNGDAAEYGNQMEKRLEIMYSGKKGILELEPLTVQPKLLYFSDITEDITAWENDGMKRFLGVEGVVLKKR